MMMLKVQEIITIVSTRYLSACGRQFDKKIFAIYFILISELSKSERNIAYRPTKKNYNTKFFQVMARRFQIHYSIN